MLTIEIAIPEAPVRYHASTCTGSRLSRWGSGSHTAPKLQPAGRQAVEHATGHDQVSLGVVVAQRQALLPIDQRRHQAPAEREPREPERQARLGGAPAPGRL